MDTPAARQLLEAERARLTEIIDAAGHNLADLEVAEQPELSLPDQHPADAASELGERETQQATNELVEADLREVDAAVMRLEAGTYGVCEACGRPIADERLEALPAARLCIEDQARAEQQRS
jgi:RNA polymerase-binding transcription factor DksA